MCDKIEIHFLFEWTKIYLGHKSLIMIKMFEIGSEILREKILEHFSHLQSTGILCKTSVLRRIWSILKINMNSQNLYV